MVEVNRYVSPAYTFRKYAVVHAVGIAIAPGSGLLLPSGFLGVGEGDQCDPRPPGAGPRVPPRAGKPPGSGSLPERRISNRRCIEMISVC